MSAVPGSYRITYRFMVWVTLAIASGAFVIWTITIRANYVLLETAGQKANVDVARILIEPKTGNMAEFVEHFSSDHQDNPDNGQKPIHNLSEIQKLRDYLHAQTRSGDILKIKIFNLDGRIVFSTTEREFGETGGENPGMIAALKGNTVTDLVPEDEFDEFEREVAGHNIIETYLPLRNDQGAIIGAFEIYSDGTDVLASIVRFRSIIATILIVISVIILGVLYLALQRIEGRLISGIRERAQLQAQTDQLAEMNRVKTEFLALLSHELRTPLNAIVGFSDLMVQEILGPVEPEKYRSYVAEIHNSGRELTGILNKVLFMSSLVTNSVDPAPVEFDMKDAVNTAVAHHLKTADRRRIAIKVTQPSEPLGLYCDQSHVIDAISNLVSNAVKYAPEGSTVTVGHGICSKTIDTDGMCRDDPCVVVTDHGPGIDASKRDALIQVFSQEESSLTRTRGGLGLGLPIAQALAHLNGGELIMGDTPNGGAKVALVFPLSSLVESNRAASFAA